MSQEPHNHHAKLLASTSNFQGTSAPAANGGTSHGREKNLKETAKYILNDQNKRTGNGGSVTNDYGTTNLGPQNNQQSPLAGNASLTQKYGMSSSTGVATNNYQQGQSPQITNKKIFIDNNVLQKKSLDGGQNSLVSAAAQNHLRQSNSPIPHNYQFASTNNQTATNMGNDRQNQIRPINIVKQNTANIGGVVAASQTGATKLDNDNRGQNTNVQNVTNNYGDNTYNRRKQQTHNSAQRVPVHTDNNQQQREAAVQKQMDDFLANI